VADVIPFPRRSWVEFHANKGSSSVRGFFALQILRVLFYLDTKTRGTNITVSVNERTGRAKDFLIGNEK